MESELMENDPFANINETLLKEEYKHHIPIQEYFFIIGEFLVFLACLIAAAANVFLSTTILRFKKLRTRLNIYILNIALLNVFNHLLGILLFLTDLLGFLSILLVTIELHIQNTVQALHVVFSVLLASDWFLSARKSYWITLYSPLYKIIFFAIYTFFLIEGLIAFAYAEMHHYIRFAVFNAVYVICLIFMIILNILKRFVRLKGNPEANAYAFTVANIFVFAYLPVWIYHTMTLFFINIETSGVLIIVSVLPALVWIIHPIIVVIVLGACNKHFKIAYMKTFRRTVDEYDCDDLDNESGNNIFPNNISEANVNYKVEDIVHNEGVDNVNNENNIKVSIEKRDEDSQNVVS